ncbi:MAG TPA: MFS transporter, partial [Streptosporangiaceae bacterium]|nr:MFS transporter [Streptosporangiaceae bacterium]
IPVNPCADRRVSRGLRHDAGVATFAAGLRRPFARYWLSGFLADFGDGVRLAAFPLLAAQLTRSPAAVAAVTAVQGLPWLLLGGGLGVVVDRTDRRRLMVAVDVARAAVIVALAAAILAHGAGLWLIYLTAFVTGAGSALRDTAAVTCVPAGPPGPGQRPADRGADRGQRTGRPGRGWLAVRPGCRAALRGQRRHPGHRGAAAAHAPWRVRRPAARTSARTVITGTTSPRACAGSGRTATCGT